MALSKRKFILVLVAFMLIGVILKTGYDYTLKPEDDLNVFVRIYQDIRNPYRILTQISVNTERPTNKDKFKNYHDMYTSTAIWETNKTVQEMINLKSDMHPESDGLYYKLATKKLFEARYKETNLLLRMRGYK